MHLSPKSLAGRAQAAACVLAVTAALLVVPALAATADASPARPSASAGCTKAQAAVKKARHDQAVAKQQVAKAKKALKKAKKAHAHKKAKVAKAKKALKKANKRYQATTRATKARQSQARTACATTAPPSTNPVENTGKKLSLLGLGDGLALGTLDASQLTSLLNQLLPGVTDHLSADQLSSLLAGFNAGSDLDPTDALALLTGVLSPEAITDLLGGSASPEALTSLITDVIGELSGLGGNLPIPSTFDPTGLWQTFAGIFGNLDPGQLGSLLSLLTSAFGSAGGSFDVDQLTDLIDSLVPGISDQFDADQLTSMLAGLNGSGLSAATLANLLGGQFSIEQLQSVIGGTAGQALLGSVITQVMAQLGTAGSGGLQLPSALDPTQLTTLISTMTTLFTGLLGGGGVLPVVCGLIPIPVLCP